MHTYKKKWFYIDMDSQILDNEISEPIKIDQALQLSLKIPVEERMESTFLNYGFENANSLQVIVRYTGNMKDLEEMFPDTTVIELLNGFAIITTRADYINALSALPQITYIEKPKRLSLGLQDSRSASCLSGVQKNIYTVETDVPNALSGYGLSGLGTFIGIIDSGIDYRHPAFLSENGESRIAYFWNQAAETLDFTQIPAGYGFGAQYTKDMITEALAENRPLPSTETGSGHGTSVAGIAAGNGAGSPGLRYRGVATESELIVVRLRRKEEDFAGTTEVMLGVDYAVRKAIMENKPIAINLSFGTNDGSHTGQSLFETYLSELLGTWKTTIVAASGNEGDARHHSRMFLDTSTREVEFSIGPGENSLSLQIWKDYTDEFQMVLESPSGKIFSFPEENGIPFRYPLRNGTLIFYIGTPTPFTMQQPVFLEWISDVLETGIWKLSFLPKRIITGIVDLWLPTVEAIGKETGFLNPEPDTTLTIPSAARNVITVGAYRTDTGSIAAFSGRGYTADGRIKPTLVAPGVNVMTTVPGGGYGRRTGTSIAAPFVTGSAALLMEWGIVRGNDPFLYGEKLKAYLIKGARPLPEQTEIPDTEAGYGALCVRDSIP